MAYRYALSIVMWEIASRRIPYELASPTIISSVVPIGDREEILEDCPPGYMELVQRCWHEKPEERPDVDQVLAEVMKIAHSLQ